MTVQPLALVTGAARRLGREFARVLSQEGYAVAIHYLTSAHEAEATAEDLRSQGTPAFLLKADLTDPTAIQQMFEHVDEMPHTLRVLVNSASRFRATDYRTMDVLDWNETLNLNLRAPFLCAREAASRMVEGGVIINISDIGARKSWTRFPAYSVSKAGLDALTRVLARAYAPKVRVNAIAPGLILRSKDTPEAEWDRLVQRLPMRRAGRSDEIAEALRFLLTNEYVTGQTLVIDGGYSLIG